MPFTLYVVSKSTENYFKSKLRYIVQSRPEYNLKNKKVKTGLFVYKEGPVVAIGGGSVIDTAKLIAGNRPCYAIPTTASGAAMTSWAVVWKKGKKISVKTPRPVLVEAYRNLKIKLSKQALQSTIYDCWCHIADSRNSINSTTLSLKYCDIAQYFLRIYLSTKEIKYLIEAGNYAGRAIEITGTNFFHAISYVLTLEHGLTHGQALKVALEMQDWVNWNDILKKARKYKKFKEIGP